MAWLDDRHMEQIERENQRRFHLSEFLRHHPEWREDQPLVQQPAQAEPLLSGLPEPIAQAFVPLVVTPGDEPA